MTSTFAINDTPSSPADLAPAADAPFLEGAPSTDAPVTEGDAPAGQPQPDLTALQQQIAELAEFKTASEREKQEAQQQQQEQQGQARQAQTQQALNAFHKQLTDEYAMPAEQAAQAVGLVAAGTEYIQKQQWLSTTVQRDMAYQEAMTALGDDATVAQVKAAAQMLTQYTDPRSLRAAAQQLAPVWQANRQALTAGQQAQLRQQIVNSGATRVEGGQGAGGGGMSDQEFINRWADTDNPLPSSRENAERAKRLTERGIWARAQR